MPNVKNLLQTKPQFNSKLHIWFNPHIKPDNKVIFWKNWYKCGITWVQDLINSEGKLLSFEEFSSKYFSPQFTRFYGIMEVLKVRWPELRETVETFQYPTIPQELELILKYRKGSHPMYNIFIEAKSVRQKSYTKWMSDLSLNIDNCTWEVHNYLPFSYTKDTKLQWLQYRILNRIIATNKLLFTMKKRDNANCSFGCDASETLIHLFVNCPMVSRLWTDLKSRISEKINFNVNLTNSDILLGLTGNYIRVLKFWTFWYVSSNTIFIHRELFKGNLQYRVIKVY